MGDTGKSCCFYYREQRTEYHISYCNDTGKFSCRTIELLDPVLARKYIDITPRKATSAPKEFLYQLLKGDQERLCELAQPTAICLSAEKLFDGAIVLAFENSYEVFKFISMVGGKDLDTLLSPRRLKQLTKQLEIDELIEMKMHGQPFAICVDKGERLNAEQWIRLKKIFRGVRLTCKDSVLGRKMHRSTAQWFIIGDDQTMSRLKAHKIKAWRLSLNLAAPSCISGMSWIQRIFPLWGYLQLNAKNKTAQGPKFETVQFFMERCCQITKREGEFVPAKDLYDHYTAYCNSQNWEHFLKLKDFNDVLETEYKLKRSRHHFTDGRNPTGYRNILFTTSTQGQVQKEQEVLSSKELFFQKLDQMEEEVRAHFDQYPL